MRTSIMLAWLSGMGIITWRTVSREGHPPLPGQILGASALFGLLGLVAEYQPAATFAGLLAWGFDLSALLSAWPSTTVAPVLKKTPAKTTEAASTAKPAAG